MDIIQFKDLINKEDFDTGANEVAKSLMKITEVIEQAKQVAGEFATLMGTKLKGDIKLLSAASRTLAKDMAVMEAKMNQFKTATSNTSKVISDYEKENKKLNAELAKLRTQLSQVSTTQTAVNKSAQQGVVNAKQLAQSFLGVASGAALIQMGIQGLKHQLTEAVKSTIEFEKTMKAVQAVSNATGDELKLLTDNANKLGATTEKTAQQIAEAQKELAKLGFSTPEILLATAAIVDLSTATGEDLVKSAEVAASTIRSFGLEVSDLSRVTDVMTKSFIISALDLEKFKESIKLVAPIAAATGIGIETITASLAKLSDTGISGSLAGTAMRNLISSMADPTEDLVKFLGQYDESLKGGVKSSDDFTRALKVLKGANVSLEQAVGMVDVRARSAFFNLVNYADDVEYLSLQLTYLDGETKKTAKTMRENLANDIDIATSAFDSMRRNLVEGYIPAMRDSVQATTTMIEAIRLFNSGVIYQNSVLSKIIKVYVDYIKTVNPLSVSYTVATKALSLFGVTWESFEATVAKGKASETFESVTMNVDKMIDGFSEFEKNAVAHKKANELLSSGLKVSDESVSDLREGFEELSSKFSDNTLFLKMLRGETKETINTTQGFITALEAEENKLKDVITVTKEEITKNGESASSAGTLKEATELLTIVQELRCNQEAELVKILGEVGISQGIVNEVTEESIKLTSKLTKLRGELNGVYAKNREEQAKIAFEEEDDLDKKLVLLDKLKQARVATAKQSLNSELEMIEVSDTSSAEKEIERQIAYAEHKGALLAIDEDYYKQSDSIRAKALEKEIDLLSKMMDEYEERASKLGKDKNSAPQEAIAKSLESLEDELNASDKLLADWHTENLKKSDERDEEERKRKLFIAAETARALVNIGTSVFTNRQILREQELLEIQRWEQEKLDLAGDNEEAKRVIREEAARQEREIKIKQAKDNKAEAMFQILIDTAMAVMTTFGQTGIFGIPLAAIMGALGAAQLAAVAARPIPQFEKGTLSSPEGIAEVAERGRELIVDGKTGQARIAEGRQFTQLTKGSIVVPNAQTEQLLRVGQVDHNSLAFEALKRIENKPQKSFNLDYDRLEKAIQSTPQSITNFDERGVTNYIRRGTSRVQRLNKRYRLD